MGWCVQVGCTTSVPSVIKCSAAGSGGVRRSDPLSRPHLPRNGPNPSPSATTVLERELLATSRNARLVNHHRNEDANLILQLGTVVTAALNDIDSPHTTDCSRTATSSRPLLPTRQHFVEHRRQENRNNASTEAKPRTNNHILPYQFVLQDHNYGAPPPPTPPLSPTPPSLRPPTTSQQHAPPPLTAQDLCGMAALATVADQVRAGSTSLSSLLLQAEEDSRGSPLSSDEQDEPGPEGEETETAAEGEGDEDSVTRCICDFEHDDGYMICCDKCCVWQHVDCMGIDRGNIPEEYLCEVCQPRRVDKPRARNLQLRKQMHNDTSSSDDEASSSRHPPAITPVRRLSGSVPRKRPAKREAKKVVKRQRRDSAAVAAREQRVSERRANKRKESLLAATATTTPVKSETKRIGARRRSKGKPDSLDEDTQDCWGNSTPVTTTENTPTPTTGGTKQLRQWIDSYEEAVTNHYSPELRARISNIKVNGVHSDFKVASSAVQRCRTSMQENGTKVLIATSTLHANQPIIEVRGKYMLANQQSVRRGGALSPSTSPYLLLYQLPKEGTEVCVDARTYGNDARFVRRSCKPNAEVRHCIEKGTLHLYLVASTAVDRHAEITIKHEDGGARTPCKDCPPPPCPTPVTPRNGFLNQELSERGERRRRGSRRTTSSEEGVTTAEPTPSPPAAPTPAPPPPPPPPPVPAPAPVVVAPVVPTPSPPAPPPPPAPVSPPVVQAPVVSTPVTRRGPKSPVKTTPAPPSTPTPAMVAQGEDSNEETSPQDERESAADKRKMVSTREERKMEAIMKAFERLEKAEQRKQESLARQQQHTRRGGERDSGGESAPVSRHASREEKDEEPQDNRRKGRRTRGRSSSGASNQATSADESSGPPLLSPATPASPSPRTLASPPPPAAPSPEKNPAVLLNNCLGFKFPKTKKVLMNEWLSKPTTDAPVSPVKVESPEEGPMMGRSGSAAVKKRWLRQAISEECDNSAVPPTCSSPNSRAGSPPIGDYVTPLKKRRLARESVSSEQSFTPPTTPASDKEGTRSPDLEEGAVTTTPLPPPPAVQIRNAARCVEEAVMVLSADTDFMEQMVGEKMVEAKRQEELKPLVVKPEPPVEVKEEKPELVKPEVVAEVIKDEMEEPPLQAPCTPPPPPPTPPSAPSTPSSVTSSSESKDCMKEVLTPASIKRKLSISEYRQRKQREGGEKGDGSEGTTSPTSQDDERPSSAGASPTDPLLEINDIKTEGSVSVGGAYMRWSSEPTLVERQRENLTERLKREFGLFLDEQDPARVAAAAASKKAAGVVANNPGSITANNKCTLPILPPLEPPALRTSSPHNIPLPTCSPPPLHDLLSEPPPPPLVEAKTPVTTTTSNNHSKSGSTKNTITSTVVQNGPSCIKPSPQGKSLLLGGGVQIKNQTVNKTPVSQNTQINNAFVLNNKKHAIASCSTSGLHNNITRPNPS